MKINELAPIITATLAIIAGVIALFLAVSASAQHSLEAGQTPTELGTEATSESIRDALAQMSDQDVRTMLLARLDEALALQSEPDAQKSLFLQIKELGEAAYSPFLLAIRQFPQTLRTQGQSVQNFLEQIGEQDLLRLAALIALSIAAGFVAEFIVMKTVRRLRPAQGNSSEHALFKALRLTYQRFWREAVGLFAFVSVASLVATTVMSSVQLSFASPFLVYLVALPRAAAVFSRFVLSPSRPELRIVSVNDTWSRFLYRHQIGLASVSGFALFLIAFNSASGVAPGEFTVGYWLNFFVHIYIAWIAWTAREGLRQMMRGADPDRTKSDERIALAYPFFAIIVSLGLWLIVNIAIGFEMYEVLRNAPHLTTMFWLLMAPLFDTAIRGTVKNLNPEMTGEGQVAEEAYTASKRSYIRIGRVFAVGLVVLIIASAWNVDLTNLTNAGLGLRIVAASFETILIVAVGYIAFELVSLWINRKLAREQTLVVPTDEDIGAGEGGGAGASRLSTVLPLLRSSAQIAIAMIFSLLAIGSLGIDITPLLAGFGVVGVAIGFGAQRLVSDVVAGIFFLIDDAFRRGEYVQVGTTMGTVEQISIRSMQLRHHRGPIHTIPYGEIPTLTNFSRDWVIMKLRFTVPFDTDPNKVKKIFKKIGAELLEDPTHADGFLEPFKSQGVFEFDDVGMVIRGKFMAKPGSQFTLRKEIFNRVKREFEAAGIEFARREVRIAMPSKETEEDLADFEKAAITAAGEIAIDAAATAGKKE